MSISYANQPGPCTTGTFDANGCRTMVSNLPSFVQRNIPASAPTIRKERRALVKALGSRQFKKLYRSAP